MPTTDPKEQFYDVIADYTEGWGVVDSLDNWLTEDLTMLAHLIDVELQERAFRTEFKSVFHVDCENESNS
jgi:hypothetical protein